MYPILMMVGYLENPYVAEFYSFKGMFLWFGF